MWKVDVEHEDNIGAVTRRDHGDFSLGCVVCPLSPYAVLIGATKQILDQQADGQEWRARAHHGGRLAVSRPQAYARRYDHPIQMRHLGVWCWCVFMRTAIQALFSLNRSVAGEPKLIAQLPPPANQSCYFVFEWRTHVACPTRARGSSWGALAILASM